MSILPKRVVLEMARYTAPLEGRRGKLRLDFNENTQGFPWAYGEHDVELITAYPEYEEFINKLAAHWQIQPENLLLTNGSDEALLMIATTFIEPNEDTAVVSKPTFAMVPHYLKLCQAQLAEVSVLDSLEFDLEGIEEALKNNPKLAMFPSPENPTGSVIPLEKIEYWCHRFPKVLFAIDEAYAEFSGQSVIPLTGKFNNLIVTKTFSKAWGMAGLRLGALIAHPDLIAYMQKTRSPYNVNAIAIQVASKIIDNAAEFDQQCQSVIACKNAITPLIEQRGYQVKSGSANFFLMKIGLEAQLFSDFCAAHGLLVRNRSSMHKLWGQVRVTVGTPEQMNQFLTVLDAFRNERALIFDLDDTLVDTSKSYDEAIAELVQKYSGQALKPGELKALRALGGYNDDWDATVGLLAARNQIVSRNEIERHGKKIYLERARQVETPWIDLTLLKRLSQRYRLLIVTGRPRDEYEPVWGDRLTGLFERVVCHDDYGDLPKKPAPDIFHHAMRELGIQGGMYVGNSVDDVEASLAAGLLPINVSTTNDAETLQQAGAHTVLENINQLEELLALPKIVLPV